MGHMFLYVLKVHNKIPVYVFYIYLIRSDCKTYGNWCLFCTSIACSTTCRMWSSTIDWDSLSVILSHFRIWKQLSKNIFLYNCFQIVKWNKITPIESHRSLCYIIQYPYISKIYGSKFQLSFSYSDVVMYN